MPVLTVTVIDKGRWQIVFSTQRLLAGRQ